MTAEAYSKPCQISKMDHFAKIAKVLAVNCFYKMLILCVWQGPD